MLSRSKVDYHIIDEDMHNFTLKIYNQLFISLIITAIAASAAVSFPVVSNKLFITDQAYNLIELTPVGQFMMILPIFIALYFSFGIFTLSSSGALIVLWIYSASVGISIAPIAFIYTGASIARTFLICAGLFGVMSLYGYTTKRNLLSLTSFLVMGLCGIILASIANMFLQSPTIYFVESFIGICIFIGLIAIDTQKIKMIYYNSPKGELSQKLSIIAALSIYLDIINLFLYTLRFLGGYRKKHDD